MDFWESLKNWIVDNIRPVTYLIAGVVVVLLLGAGVAEYLKHREQVAVEAVYNARQKLEALPADKKLSEGKEIMLKVAAEQSGTRAAYEALLTIADLYSDAKNFAEAAGFYEKAAKAAPDDFARIMAIYNKGGAEESAGNCAAAVVSYGELQKQKAAAFLAPEALLAEGRCHEELKQYAQAEAAYKKIQDQFPNNASYNNAAQVFSEKLKPFLKN